MCCTTYECMIITGISTLSITFLAVLPKDLIDEEIVPLVITIRSTSPVLARFTISFSTDFPAVNLYDTWPLIPAALQRPGINPNSKFNA